MTKKCDNKNCTVHGSLVTRGRTFVGTVTSTKAQHTATIEWSRRKHIPKYERYMVQRTRVQAHCPPCLEATRGDKVRITECRPLSKTKKFVIIEKVGQNIAYLEKEQAMQMAEPEEKKGAEKKVEEKNETN